MSASPQRRSRAVAIVLIVAALVAAPTAAAAYWIATATTTATARSATFAISGPQPIAVTLGGSKDDLKGFTGSAQASTVVTNSGEVGWERLNIAAPSVKAFDAPAQVALRLALVSPALACPAASSAYSLASPTGEFVFTTPAARVAPGASVKICVDVGYSRVSMINRGSSATMRMVVQPRLHEWAANATPADVTVAAPSAGVAKCESAAGWLQSAAVTFEAPADGTYETIVDGAVTSRVNLRAGEAHRFQIADAIFDAGRKPVLVKLVDPTGQRRDVASSSVNRGIFGALSCVS